ncbi:MAG TPA: hypothetical protein P5277_03720 [Candidatus Paceibacterota bacterium]|nr:hypothetical protein [Candidatus Paceibacterota bacterium]
MAILDFSWLSYYMAIFGFLFVFTVMYAILTKTKILGENAFSNALVSFVIAIIFITFSPGVEYIGTFMPWFSILVICVFCVLVIIGFSQKEMDKFMKPWFAWVGIIILIFIFVLSAIKVFNPILGPYLPGGDKAMGFFYSEKFLGGAILLIIAAAAAWVLTKKR